MSRTVHSASKTTTIMKLLAKTEEQRDHILSILEDSRTSVIQNDDDGIYIDDFISFDDMAKIVDYLRTPNDKHSDLFEECWKAYRRKGSKKKAKDYWNKLKDSEYRMVLPHIKAYVSSRELRFQLDFERYLRDKAFMNVVFMDNSIIYDPMIISSGESSTETYTPTTSGLLSWTEYHKCYMYIGFFDGKHIPDGYDDNNRPDGARVTLNNGRGTIQWNKASKAWEKI